MVFSYTFLTVLLCSVSNTRSVPRLTTPSTVTSALFKSPSISRNVIVADHVRPWIAHGGHMVRRLLLIVQPFDSEVLTSFHWATDYFIPNVCQGNSTITRMSSSFNDTRYEVIYRCESCFAWTNGEGCSVSVKTSEG